MYIICIHFAHSSVCLKRICVSMNFYSFCCRLKKWNNINKPTRKTAQLRPTILDLPCFLSGFKKIHRVNAQKRTRYIYIYMWYERCENCVYNNRLPDFRVDGLLSWVAIIDLIYLKKNNEENLWKTKFALIQNIFN